MGVLSSLPVDYYVAVVVVVVVVVAHKCADYFISKLMVCVACFQRLLSFSAWEASRQIVSTANL